MNHKAFLFLSVLLFTVSCQGEITEKNQIADFAQEKAAILQVLNEETKAAFNRDYEGWKDKWVHEKYVTKTYMNFADSSMTETLGWEEINDFVKTYLEEHPEPAPIPKLVDAIEVRLYGKGAWVNYEQNDAKLGLKKETRLMEKVEGQWKIAGMQTVIYGFDD